VREEAWVMSLGVSDVAVCVSLGGRVRLGSHYPSERREGRMDVDGFILVFFAHVWRGRVLVSKERKGVIKQREKNEGRTEDES